MIYGIDDHPVNNPGLTGESLPRGENVSRCAELAIASTGGEHGQ